MTRYARILKVRIMAQSHVLPINSASVTLLNEFGASLLMDQIERISTCVFLTFFSVKTSQTVIFHSRYILDLDKLSANSQNVTESSKCTCKTFLKILAHKNFVIVWKFFWNLNLSRAMGVQNFKHGQFTVAAF